LKEIFLQAPATIANFGPGFDTFCLALAAPLDYFHIRRKSSRGITIRIIDGQETLPTEPEKNTAGLAALHFFEKSKAAGGVDIEIIKKTPSAAGLGTSAASAVAAAYGMNKLFEAGLSEADIIEIAGKGEAASGGTPHLDNVSGCCLGGFVFVRSFQPLRLEKIVAPEIPIVIRVRKKSVTTSRGLIPEQLVLRQVKEQMAWCAAVVHAVKSGDLERIGEAINRDHISEPVRSLYIPGYQALKKRVLEAGAFGVNVCGGGSSVFAICDKEQREVVAEAMSLPLEGDKEPPLVLTTKSSNQGVMEIDGL